MKKLLEKLKNIKISTKVQIRAYLLIIFISMLILNVLTPLIADDYSFAINIKGEHLRGLKDIIDVQANYYLSWGGRIIAHTIGQTFLLFPKIIFSICNSIVYTALVYLIYKHAKNENDDKPLVLPIIHLLMFFAVPVFGQTTIWLIGSCNYLWTTTIILFFLYEMKSGFKDTKLRIMLMFLLGIIAGWTNENSGVGVVVIAFLTILFHNLKITKKKKLKFNIVKYQIAGTIGTLIGFAGMILAPGNYVRSSMFPSKDPFIIRIIKRTIECTECLYDNILLLVIITIVLITLNIYHKKQIDKKVWIYLTGAFLAIYSMVMAPGFAERAWFGVIAFMNVGIFTLIFNLEECHRIYKLIMINVVLIGSLFFIKEYTILSYDILKLRNIWNDRIEQIEKSKKKEYEFEMFISNNKKNPNYGIADIVDKEHEWPNNTMEEYFHVESIKGIFYN